MSTARRRRAVALLLAVSLVAAGLGLALAADKPPLQDRWQLPWPLLIPLYIAATHLSLEFRRRDSSVGVTLVQLPLALGVVLVDPLQHVLARLVASAAVSLSRRQDGLKVTCNLGFASLEVGVAALAVSLVPGLDGPGPLLSVALLAGLLVGEVSTMLLLNLLIRLLDMPVSRRQLLEPMLVTAVTSTAWTGFAILTISAAWIDPWTLLLVVFLAAGLAVLYRAHRRLALQQQATEDLYVFVKDLGPVDVEQSEALAALEHVRELLHARHLELTVVDAGGGPTHRLSVHVDAAPRHEQQVRPALGPARPDLRDDCMRTPMLADGAVLGVLTATQRVGVDRGFDMRDLRLLETVATELATALDRGRLLRDLGRAATTDPLTGLPNLSSTTVQLDAMTRSGVEVVLVAVTVVPYREVNDTLGHAVGDELLREVAARLQRFAPHALVGRTGGDRFAVAVPAARGDDAALLGLRLRSEVEGGPPASAATAHLRLAVGCACSLEHGTEAATLLRRAETAMNSARHAHGGPVVWAPAYEVQGQRRLAVVMALREALATGAVGTAYQPKVRCDGRSCSGVEALARWTHPAMGVVEPEEFVPLAEASGLMALLTQSVLRQALTACRSWQRPRSPVGVSVNISADTLQDARFVTDVAAVLAEVGVEPGLLTLELTENVVVDDPRLATERMLELRALGVRLSVDDFGTGYSSLTYLKGLPIDEVKIDKSFVVGLVGDPGDQAVVRAVIDIAHTLGVRVVAEGVEHEDQHALLDRLGVDEVQGYLHAPPMVFADMYAWLDRRLDVAGPSLTQIRS